MPPLHGQYSDSFYLRVPSTCSFVSVSTLFKTNSIWLICLCLATTRRWWMRCNRVKVPLSFRHFFPTLLRFGSGISRVKFCITLYMEIRLGMLTEFAFELRKFTKSDNIVGKSHWEVIDVRTIGSKLYRNFSRKSKHTVSSRSFEWKSHIFRSLRWVRKVSMLCDASIQRRRSDGISHSYSLHYT